MAKQTIDFTKTITKSSFLKGWQCKKYLWLHRKEPINKDKFENQRQIFRKIDAPLAEYARKLYPNGQFASRKRNETEADWVNSIEATQELIKKGVETIYNASLCVGNLVCDYDIITKQHTGWKLVVVKTATRFSQRSLHGTVFRYHVMQNAGLTTTSITTLLLNNTYRRKGQIQVEKLFSKKEILPKVEQLYPSIKQNIEEQITTLQQEHAPNVKIGPHCTEPHDCNYRYKCWKHIPRNSVFDLVGFSKEGMFDLYKRGFKLISETPENQQLAFSQKVQQEQKPRIVKPKIRAFLNEIQYPALLVDFEAFIPAVPTFENSKPFELLPFLFAGILINHPEDKGEYVHHLVKVGNDPRKDFSKAWVNLSGKVNSILVYDPLTEKSIIKNLIRFNSDLKNELKSSIDKIIDLSIPIHNKDFYLPQMKGYHSMKYVLPAIDRSLSYSDLAIQSGRQAATTYQMLLHEKDQDLIKQTESQLLEYCQRDTLGLLKVFKALTTSVK